MILKRVEKDNIIKALYDSSNVIGSKYDKTTQDLIIIFKGGTQYKYPKVSLSDYTRLEVAESQGVVFNSHIKKYDHEKLGNIDITQLLVEADTLKVAEQEALVKAKYSILMDWLKMYGNIFIENDDSILDRLPDNHIQKFQSAIDEYKLERDKLKSLNG